MPLNAKDLALYNAIKKNQALNTTRALQNGANIFAEIDIIIAGKTRRTTLFGFALFADFDPVVEAILSTCTNIDISKPFDIYPTQNVESVHPINLLQFAYVYSTNSIIEALISYATTNGRHVDVASLLNKRFYRPGTTQPTTVASEALLTFSTHLLVNAKRTLSASIDLQDADKDMSEWIWLLSDERGTLTRAEHIELVADFSKKLKDLLARGFNTKLIDCFGLNLGQLIQLIVRCSTNPELWEKELAPKITFCGMTKAGPATLNAAGTDISIPVLLSNMQNSHIRRVTLTQDIKRLKAVYAAFLKAQKAKELQAPSHALVAKVDGLHADLHALADQRLKDIQTALDAFPPAKTCFDTLQRHLESSLTLECMAATGMIALNPSKLVQHAQNAALAMSMLQTTLTALNVAAQFSPVPFVGIIPMVLDRLVDLAQKTRAAAKSKGVFNATLGMDLKGITIDVAAIVSAEAYLTHKGALNTGVINTLVSDVVKQLKALKDAEIIDEAHLVGFLAQAAITRLRATRDANAAKLAHGATALVPSFARLSDDDEEAAFRRATAPSTASAGLFGHSPKGGSNHSGSSSVTARSPAQHSGDRSGSGSHHGSNSSPTAPAPACCVTM